MDKNKGTEQPLTAKTPTVVSLFMFSGLKLSIKTVSSLEWLFQYIYIIIVRKIWYCLNFTDQKVEVQYIALAVPFNKNKIIDSLYHELQHNAFGAIFFNAHTVQVITNILSIQGIFSKQAKEYTDT